MSATSRKIRFFAKWRHLSPHSFAEDFICTVLTLFLDDCYGPSIQVTLCTAIRLNHCYSTPAPPTAIPQVTNIIHTMRPLSTITPILYTCGALYSFSAPSLHPFRLRQTEYIQRLAQSIGEAPGQPETEGDAGSLAFEDRTGGVEVTEQRR